MEGVYSPVTVLDDEACWQRLRTEELGRLVTRVGEVLDIFPVNYVVDGESILFRTAQGSKLFELTVNDEVLFEVDHHTDEHAWSVVVRGHARALDDSASVERADGMGLKPWIPTLKYTYVRVEPTVVTGRAFDRGPEPDRYGIQQY
ncbi:pyridoxamine 5'-phosphate oxidase family protein [Microbacterium aurantiacum]|uniref:Pyridoxamine 5-phosphate oxidase n=2 Tax=Microbacterium aurantiacum TaxID=162393 RepID=A0A0M8MDZ0_9MICO|nr:MULTISPECIES: pyridoxamine 5'-phosphate oxidase family protein [Microbacterium]ANG84039.1 pyridoxamine 5-phosphate oxidase [Microbacterium chocolatum]KOS10486.1 pyridoxamine 5-phosphate oxidase [Microbacterium chocolatum]MDS0245591.1 pyridoxamine 5'-phosphate oxidase family protein [Microbacterium aurantiacum]